MPDLGFWRIAAADPDRVALVEPDHSEHTAQLIDEEVARILREEDDRAYRVLSEHRDDLERLTEALLDREVLSVAEIEAMIGKRPGSAPMPDYDIVASLNNPVSESGGDPIVNGIPL